MRERNPTGRHKKELNPLKIEKDHRHQANIALRDCPYGGIYYIHGVAQKPVKIGS